MVLLCLIFAYSAITGEANCVNPVNDQTPATSFSAPFEFTADFKMILKDPAYQQSFDTLGIKNDTYGYYYGTMYYYFIPHGYGNNQLEAFSYRKMTFVLPHTTVTEIIVHASAPEEQDKVVTMKMSRCNGKCYFKYLKNSGGQYYGVEKIPYKGTPSGTDTFSGSFVPEVFYNPNGSIRRFSEDLLFSYNLTNVKFNINNLVEPTYFAKDCATKTCNVDINFIFSVDVSGSMSGQIGYLKTLINDVATLFKVGESKTSVALIAWAYKSQLLSGNLASIFSSGFLTNATVFATYVNKLAATGETCYTCGFKAGVEASYVQYLYEIKNFNPDSAACLDQKPTCVKHPLLTGRVMLLMTDGQPTVNLNQNNHAREFTIKQVGSTLDTSQHHWSCCPNFNHDTDDCNYTTRSKKTNYYDYNGGSTTSIFNSLKNNLNSFYKGQKIVQNLPSDVNTKGFENDYEAFYDRLTIMAIGVNINLAIFTNTVKKGSDIAAADFTLQYTIKSLKPGTTEMNKFYNSLYVQVCSAFSGLQDKCADTNRLCCNGINYCPVCKQSYYGCIGTDGICTPDFYCEFNEICESNDWCNPNICAENVSPVTQYSDGKGCQQLPRTFQSALANHEIQPQDYDRCYEYKCDSIEKKFVIDKTINCYQETGSSVNKYKNCVTTCITGKKTWADNPTIEEFKDMCYADLDQCVTGNCKINTEHYGIFNSTACSSVGGTWNAKKEYCELGNICESKLNGFWNAPENYCKFVTLDLFGTEAGRNKTNSNKQVYVKRKGCRVEYCNADPGSDAENFDSDYRRPCKSHCYQCSDIDVTGINTPELCRNRTGTWSNDRCTITTEDNDTYDITNLTTVNCTNYRDIYNGTFYLENGICRLGACFLKQKEPCENSVYNPEMTSGKIVRGCYKMPKCIPEESASKITCSKAEDLCISDNVCIVPSCGNYGYDAEGHKIGSCIYTPIICDLPPLLDSRCYSNPCIHEKGGCIIVIDFDKLNDCGDCGEITSCDESALVISAAVGAGVVAAIVVVAVIALSVGMIASKKMYDMISGANEARMDAASENQLYKSADNGGANPLFGEERP